MLTQFSRSLASRFEGSVVGKAQLSSEHSRPVSGAHTKSVVSISCRFRIKPSKYPMSWIKEKLKQQEGKTRILTLNQYLAQTIRGTRIDHFHAPINKNFKKKIHAFNPFVKVDPAIAQEANEQYEYFWAQKEHGKSGQAAATEQQIQNELADLHAKQANRRQKREERVQEALSAAEQEKQAARKLRIQAKKQKARDARDAANKKDDDDYDEPEAPAKSAEFVF